MKRAEIVVLLFGGVAFFLLWLVLHDFLLLVAATAIMLALAVYFNEEHRLVDRLMLILDKWHRGRKRRERSES
jgi:hypothetical protein